jgi:Prophage CP4-57 regulatory protein (AlpA)
MKFLRFADLRDRGIVNSWPMLRRRIERDGFPPGRMLGPNTRAWSEQEIERWLASRPTAGPAPRGAAKTRRGRSRKSAEEVATA